MTINQAIAILTFIIKHKKNKMSNEDLIWLLANEFSVDDFKHTNNKEIVKKSPIDLDAVRNIALNRKPN